MKTSVGNMVTAVVMLCFLMTGVALAEKKHWFVVKDKAGVCKVIEAEAVAGPFKTMEEAEKRKAKDCPKGAAAKHGTAALPTRTGRTDAASTPAERRGSATTPKATASAAPTTKAGASRATAD